MAIEDQTKDIHIHKPETVRVSKLVEWGTLAHEQLGEAENEAYARGIALEHILLGDYHVPSRTLLQALGAHYKCATLEYDEKIPVSMELLSGLDDEKPSIDTWFPVLKEGDTVIIAVNDPEDSALLERIKETIHAAEYEFRVALERDIQWFIQDFLHAHPGYLIGTERTGLAFWRNTMAQWRTRLACYRNQMAKVRTDLALLRWGGGFIAVSDVLLSIKGAWPGSLLYWSMMAAGFAMIAIGLSAYLKIRKFGLRPPGGQTLVEVTAATIQFLENFHFIENTGVERSTKKTMLGRLGDFLASHSTILYPVPASRERTHLARERNVLAAQRTVAACYRTIHARARTGLSFIRSGVSFFVIGLGLMRYFGSGMLLALDLMLMVFGILMVLDGLLWYLPVRKEHAEPPRCPMNQE